MFSLRRTPFSTMTECQLADSTPQVPVTPRTEFRARLRSRTDPFHVNNGHLPCELAWISVVERAAMSGSVRPFESTRWEAKRVLTSVDLPRPVWPEKSQRYRRVCTGHECLPHPPVDCRDIHRFRPTRAVQVLARDVHVSGHGETRGYVPTTMTLNWKPRLRSLCSICLVIAAKLVCWRARRTHSRNRRRRRRRCPRGCWRRRWRPWWV